MLNFSANEIAPKGKKISGISRIFQDQQFNIGREEWQQKHETVTQHFYIPKQAIPNLIKKEYGNISHFEVSHGHTKDPSVHYETEKQVQFKKYNEVKRTLPVKNKTNLLQNTYTLGEEKITYSTVTKEQFYDKSSTTSDDFAMKQQNIGKYNIVNNENLSKERIKNANNYEFWNPQKSKKKTSDNVTDFPHPFTKKDIITGRVLPTSKPFYFG